MKISDYYEVRGEGSPLVFVHGSFATTSTWRSMVDVLAAEHQCILFKLPGHCGTPDPADFHLPTIDTELKLLEAVIADVTDQPVHLIGHSYGGVVALALALKKSVPLRRLTLFEPVTTWVLEMADDQATLKIVQQFLQKYRQEAKDGVPHAGGQVMDFWCDAEVFGALPAGLQEKLILLQDNNIRHWDICTRVSHKPQDLQAIEVSTSLVAGSSSSIVAHRILDVLERLLPNVERHEIQDANHLLVTTHVGACLAAM